MKTIIEVSICIFLFISFINANDIRTGIEKQDSFLILQDILPNLEFKKFYKDFGITKKKNKNESRYFIRKVLPPKDIAYNMPKKTPKKNYDYKVKYFTPKGYKNY